MYKILFVDKFQNVPHLQDAIGAPPKNETKSAQICTLCNHVYNLVSQHFLNYHCFLPFSLQKNTHVFGRSLVKKK